MGKRYCQIQARHGCHGLPQVSRESPSYHVYSVIIDIIIVPVLYYLYYITSESRVVGFLVSLQMTEVVPAVPRRLQ